MDNIVIIVGGATLAGLVYAYYAGQGPSVPVTVNSNPPVAGAIPPGTPKSLATSSQQNNNNLMQTGAGGQSQIIANTTANQRVTEHVSAMSPSVLAAYMQTHGGNPNASTADQFNWYYSNATGVKQTADLFPAGNRGALMTVQQYFAARQSIGI